MDKYSLFGKNTSKIASFLQCKTVADCVEFYYMNRKSAYFPKTKEKSVLEKLKSYTTNKKYLITAGKRRLNQATSLRVLAAVSAMVANDRLHNNAIFCDELVTAAAADVLAGTFRFMSPSDALGCCISSWVDQLRRCRNQAVLVQMTGVTRRWILLIGWMKRSQPS